jgi:uncharacterized protein YbaR (Trm112 family)
MAQVSIDINLPEKSQLLICPYCEKKLKKINEHREGNQYFAYYIFSCPHCNKLLSISAVKMF